jgi:hypothetical protein
MPPTELAVLWINAYPTVLAAVEELPETSRGKLG